MPGVTLPTGRESVGRGSGRVGWGSLLILSYDDERWAFHSHAGYRRNRNPLGERTSLRHVSASIWLKPTQATKVVFDRSHDTDPDPATSATIRQTIVGIIHSIGSDLDLDAGIRQSTVDRALLVGATLRW